VRDINFATLGVPCQVLLPGFELDPPIQTTVIRLTPETASMPPGLDLRRAEPRRMMALRRADVPTVPRGTLVTITADGTTWRVDATDRADDGHVRVFVVPNE
jgi:hypothetical protein